MGPAGRRSYLGGPGQPGLELAPAIFTVVNPGYLLPFLADPHRTMALGALTAQTLGILAIHKIVSVKY